jgi:RNA-binding protein YhbY
VIREPEASWWEVQARSSVTVAAVREGDAGWHPEMVVARLAQLAVDDELLVVLGSGDRSVQHNLIAELRASLPRHEVVTVHVRHRHGQLLRDAATVERLLDAGSLPVVMTSAAGMHDVTAEIASYLRADRVLRVLPTADGADLCQVWERRPEPSVN